MRKQFILSSRVCYQPVEMVSFGLQIIAVATFHEPELFLFYFSSLLVAIAHNTTIAAAAVAIIILATRVTFFP